ncbi:MAG: acetyl-CoA carboxylase, biotin carboxyl carrier protein [bacterium]|nr:MAG: acetyl-CoA carboxylase, biotin carboxyl carrier protein [bacterium]
MKKELEFTEKDIKALIELFDRFQVEELNIEENGLTIELKRDLPFDQRPSIVAMPSNPIIYDNIHSSMTSQVITESNDKPPAEDDEQGFDKIVSPIVGTFYRAPSPETEPYVREGDRVTHQDTVCIIEAMKMMNEIKADQSGRIHKILVQNGDPIQPGQALFLLDTK